MYEAGVQSNPEPTRPTRPRKATMLAVLLIVFGVLGILASFLLLSIVNDSSGHGQSVPAFLYVLVYAQFMVSAAQAVSGGFVLQGRNWARVLAIALSSLNLVAAVVSLFTGAIAQAISGLAINIALIRLLNDYEVQAWCDR
ncbi:hypothetical protein [Actinoplanes sp. NPDC049265]|uniref:hypothetical protein n=1 Tax=Actinoplanes sp. NPDC049265 TaxID=3363902 RepID=UPI0037184BFA